MTTVPLADIMVSLAEYVVAAGIAPLNQYPGCWSGFVTDELWVACNGHSIGMSYVHPFLAPSATPITPFCAHFWLNGFPAVIADPRGGCGLGASEARIRQILQAQIDAHRPPPPGGNE